MDIVRESLAFQEFKPFENRQEGKCIWCIKDHPKNRSHIISKKLTVKNHTENLLRYSVCESCNNKFSHLENFILKNTPLGWVRLFFYHENNIRSRTNYILSYFYANEFHDWIVYTIEGSRKARHIICQLTLKNGALSFYSEYAPNVAQLNYNKIFHNIQDNDCIENIERRLPEDFSPRAMINGDKVIIIAKDANGLLAFKKYIQGEKIVVSAIDYVKPTDDGKVFQHFKWSKSNWGRFCAKIAFESLCLFEGTEFCLRPEFDQVRSFAISNISKQGRTLVFNKHGPVTNSDIPMPVFIDLSTGQSCPRNIKAPFFNTGLGFHNISVYEIKGWICANISISGFPPSCLVLGGPEIHLKDFYFAGYDAEEDEFHYLRLAYNQILPAILIPIKGGQMDEIAKTYSLKKVRIMH